MAGTWADVMMGFEMLECNRITEESQRRHQHDEDDHHTRYMRKFEERFGLSGYGRVWDRTKKCYVTVDRETFLHNAQQYDFDEQSWY